MKLTELGDLVNMYVQSYESLKEFCKKYIPFDMTSSEDESVEEEARSAKKMKINKFDGGISYSCSNPHLKRKQANIVCNTIHTKDIPPVEAKNVKEVKKEDVVQDPPQIQSEVGGNTFNLSIGSKRNSAFNNIRNEQQPNRFNESEIQQGQSQPQPQSIDNILYSNLLLNNWLNSIK